MNNLRYLRKQKKLTIVEVAEKIGVSKLTVLRWEHGTNKRRDRRFDCDADSFMLATRLRRGGVPNNSL